MAGFFQKLRDMIPGEVARLAAKALENKYKTYSFPELPRTVQQLNALPEASLKDPYAVAALTLAVLDSYGSDPAACYAMLDVLKGPEPLSPAEKDFLRDRLKGKEYKPRSFFDGATPENNYTPATPWTIRVHANPYSFQNEGWAVLYVKSGGGDNERGIKLRQKPSTGQWFLNDIQCLSDVRLPAAEDKWR